MKPSRCRLAHLSDIHFSKPSYSLKQFFSKRWLGNLNFFLSRKQDFITDALPALADHLERLGITHVIITGDLTTTSLEEEFRAAASFTRHLQEKGMQVFTLPGNHDQYTKDAYKRQIFYRFFNSSYAQGDQPIFRYNLKEHSVAAVPIAPHWWLVLLDTALATHLISSRGLFSKRIEQHLREVLSLIPKSDQIIVANHFPFFQHESPRKTLKGGEALRATLQEFPNVKLFLHGHTHRRCLADLRKASLPIILDSGSISHKEEGSFNVIDILETGCAIDVFQWTHGSCALSEQTSFTW